MMMPPEAAGSAPPAQQQQQTGAARLQQQQPEQQQQQPEQQQHACTTQPCRSSSSGSNSSSSSSRSSSSRGRRLARNVIGLLSVVLLGGTLAAILWPHRLALSCAWLVVEALFYLWVTGPTAHRLNRQPPGRHAPAKFATDAPRHWARFIQYCRESRRGVDPAAYLSGWFLGAPFASIRRQNVEEFVAYGFYYSTPQQLAQMGLGQAVPRMVDELEATWGLTFEPGYNPDIRFMAHLWEPLSPGFRPLAFYLSIEAVAAASRGMLRRWGFSRHRHGGLNFYSLRLNATAGWEAPLTSDSVSSSSSSGAGVGGSSTAAAAAGAAEGAATQQQPVQQQPPQQEHKQPPTAAMKGPFAAFSQERQASLAAAGAGAGAATGPAGQQQQQLWADWLRLVRPATSAASLSASSAASLGSGSAASGSKARPSFAFAAARRKARTSHQAAAAAAAAAAAGGSGAGGSAARPPVAPTGGSFVVPEDDGAAAAAAADGLDGDEVWSSPFAEASSCSSLDLELRAADSCSSQTSPAPPPMPPAQAAPSTAKPPPPAAGAAAAAAPPDLRVRSMPPGPAFAAGAASRGLGGGGGGSLRPRMSAALLCPRLSMKTSQLLDTAHNPLQAALSEAGVTSGVTPVVFLHGIGGLPAYLELLLYLIGLANPLLVLEMRSVAMRLGRVKPVGEVADAVLAMMDRSGIRSAVIVGHSYGTFVASHLVRNHRSRVAACMLIDPVCLGMFMPTLIHSFLYHRPGLTGWSKAQLAVWAKGLTRSVISKEMHVRASVARSFFWTELNLWPEELPAGSVILLSGKDDLMDSPEVHAMFEGAAASGRIKVLFEPELAHASFLLEPEVKAAIRDEVGTILARSGSAVVGLASSLSALGRGNKAAAAAAAAAVTTAGRAAHALLGRTWSVGVTAAGDSAGGGSKGARGVMGAGGARQGRGGGDAQDAGVVVRRWSTADIRGRHKAAAAALAAEFGARRQGDAAAAGAEAAAAAAAAGAVPGDAGSGQQQQQQQDEQEGASSARQRPKAA